MSKHNFHRNFAVIIGINNYTNDIPRLETAVPDAQRLAEIIQKQHETLKPKYKAQNEYKVKLYLNANRSELEQLIADFRQGQIPLDNEKVTVTEGDRLLFYFAGHGIALDALESQDGPVGYLIPQDAKLNDSSTYLPMQKLHDALNELDCKHMLAILDCCFGGAFRWSSLKREAVRKVKVYKERYDRFISDRAWQVITSAADDQTALDSLVQRGIVKDGNEVHSPFAKALFDALRGETGNNADLNLDGIITATELYSYLRDRVEISTEKHYQRQTPSLCPLRKHDKGEFIFLSSEFDRDNLKDAPPLNKENNPYKGLQSYDEKDSDLFFGREEQIQKLLDKIVLHKQPLTQVVGASGTGKSSLVKAGLIPEVRKHKDGKTWVILPPFRPEESPFESLNNALASVNQPLVTSSSNAISGLLTPHESLASWFREHPQTNLVVVIDQFEELITLCKSDVEREEFQQLILNAIAQHPTNIHVVITLRLDFEALFQNSVLSDLWNNDTRFVVPPMTQDELREVIEKPALEKVLYFDPPSLVDELINEVVQMPGALPLLSFTLSELYLKYWGDRTRDNRALTKEDYEELGRVVGSITKRANQEYEELVKLDPAYKNTVERVMLRMISLQGGELARRQVPRSELVYPDPEENQRVETVIKSFSEARLIVEGSNSQVEPYVEPAHDALVQGWDKLLGWENQQQETLALQRRLTPAVNNWNQNQRATGFLWNDDPRLPQLEQVFKSPDSWLNRLETEFVKSSICQREEENINEKKQTIDLFSRASEAFFASNQQLVALIEALKAGQELQKLQDKLQKLQNSGIFEQNRAATIRKEIDVVKNQTLIALAQAVYGVKEYSRLQYDSAIALWSRNLISWSPDGQILAFACGDNTVKLLKPDGSVQTIIEDVRIVGVSWSHDGILATTSEDGNVWLWDRDGNEQKNFNIKIGKIYGVSWSPDGKELVFPSLNGKSGQVYRFRPDNLCGSVLKGHTGGVFAVSWNYDKMIASGSADRTVKLWSTDGSKLINLNDRPNWVIDVGWSPDGKIVAYACNEHNQVGLWTRDANSLLILEHPHNVESLGWSSDGIVACGSRDGTIRLWKSDGTLIDILKAHGLVQSLSWSPNGKVLASVSKNGTVQLWKTNPLVTSKVDHTSDVNSVSWSPDGQILASASNDRKIILWHRDGTLYKIIPTEKIVNSVSWSPDGKVLASASWDSVQWWTIDGEDFQSTMRNHSEKGGGTNPVKQVSWSSNGILASASWDHTVQLWDSNCNWKKTLKHEDWVESISWSPDGKLLAVGDKKGHIKIYDCDGTLLRTFDNGRNKSHVFSVSWSFDGKILASASEDFTVRLWDENGNLLSELRDHKDKVSSVSWSPNGKILASGSADNTVKLWKLNGERTTAKLLITLKGHTGEVKEVNWHPDGKILATASKDKAVKLWQLDTNLEDKEQLLENLRVCGCNWIRDYVENNPNVEESDRHLCNNLPTTTTTLPGSAIA